AGAVDGVDLSTGLLAVARARAGDDLPWLRFTAADATTWTGDAPYDVVQCGYGVFFLPDMDTDSRRLAGLLRPGGRFVVLTWHQGSLTEFTGCLVSAVEELRGERLPKPATASAAERLHTPDDLRAWLTALGLREATAEAVEHRVPLDADTSWDLVLGTGLRGMLAGFDSDQVNSVRAGLLERLSAAGVMHFDAGSVLGAGVR
ncbi:MAG TPA: methyltransferase domain-containing protein, partial [Pseudonocardiaceae bacterium]